MLMFVVFKGAKIATFDKDVTCLKHGIVQLNKRVKQDGRLLWKNTRTEARGCVQVCLFRGSDTVATLDLDAAGLRQRATGSVAVHEGEWTSLARSCRDAMAFVPPRSLVASASVRVAIAGFGVSRHQRGPQRPPPPA